MSVQSNVATSAADAGAELIHRLAQALRSGNYSALEQMSDAAACTIPLLRCLGWQGSDSELFDALPYIGQSMDMTDLRNLMVSLGYESDVLANAADMLCPELLPALFVQSERQRAGCQSQRLFVIVACDRGVYRVFDPSTGRETDWHGLPRSGQTYVFTDARASHATDDSAVTQGGWFGQTLGRFRSLIRHVFTMTLLINLLVVSVPLFCMFVYDGVIGPGDAQHLHVFLLAMLVALGVEYYLRILRGRTLSLIVARLHYLVGTEAFHRTLHLSPLRAAAANFSQQYSRLVQFDGLKHLFDSRQVLLLVELPFTLLYTAVLCWIGGWIGVLPLVMLGAFLACIAYLLPSARLAADKGRSLQTVNDHLQLDTLQGLEAIKSTGSEQRWLERSREVLGERLTNEYQQARQMNFLNVLGRTMASLTALGALVMGTVAVIDGAISVGALIAILALTWRVLTPLQELYTLGTGVQHYVGLVRSLNSFMQQPLKQDQTRVDSAVPELRGGVELVDVNLRYRPDSDPALRGLNLKLEPGQLVVLAGRNGAGKSTLLKTLAGIYETESGCVRVGGFDIRQFNTETLRQLVAYVPPQLALFHGSVAHNIRINMPQASDAQVEHAADQAGILAQIQALPAGFATVVGEDQQATLPSALVRGIGLARASLRRTPLLLLDEADTTMDEAREQSLIKHLRRLQGARTILLATHSPALISIADRVVVLRDGTVAFDGSPRDALKELVGVNRAAP